MWIENKTRVLKYFAAMTDLSAKIEAILFIKAEPVKISYLAGTLGVPEERVEEAITDFQEKLSGRGLQIVKKDGEAMLGTSRELSDMVEAVYKEEMTKDLGRAGLETLSIVLYRGPVSRSEIDYIRGVNSQFILRNLAMRGLVEKIPNPKDQRSILYRPTFELFSMLGLGQVSELPDYEKAQSEINKFFAAAEESKKEAESPEEAKGQVA